MVEKVRRNINKFDVEIPILKIKELVIQKNQEVIIERKELLNTDDRIDNDIRKKLVTNIEQLEETIKILKEPDMQYKFNGLFVYGRNGLIEAKFQPQFIEEWKLHIDKVQIPPTIYKAIDNLNIERSYNHLKFNDIMDEKHNNATALIKFSSITYNALNRKQVRSFVIACSFMKNDGNVLDSSDISFDEMNI